MKTSPADALKADLPETTWGKILGATPVILTVVATLLAGLSSSEMTSAQYDRSLAAQLQSKAGDQWNFFQGKKLRSSLQHTTLDVLSTGVEFSPLTRDALNAALASSPVSSSLRSPAGEQALKGLVDGQVPKPTALLAMDPHVRAAVDALEQSKPESELTSLLASVDSKVLEDALRAAQGQALEFDAVTGPAGQIIDSIEQQLASNVSAQPLRKSFIVARLNYNAQRYDTESRLNRNVASLYELQVRKSNLSAERHHRRSQRFFYGMLAAQMGVIISTLALAAKKRSLLWSVAAAAGAVAIIFAAYVYLYV